MGVITGTRQNKKRDVIVVEKAGHPATFRKIRCPKCSIGYAVADSEDPTIYKCARCGYKYKTTQL